MCLVFLGMGLAAAPAAWCASTATLMGVDVYGTDRFTADDIQQRFGPLIRDLVERKNSRSKAKNAEKIIDELQKNIESGVRSTWDLAWVRLSWTDYFSDNARTAYITLDVVEKKDVRSRMPFRSPPKDVIEDPNGLLALWGQFADLGWSLVRTGEMSVDRGNCRAFYCQWSNQTSEVKAMEDKFVEMVPANTQLLGRILMDDRDPKHRFAAAYLLSYVHNGNELAHFLTFALEDPDPMVRAAALRVFSDLGIFHKDVYLPIDQIINVLNYPLVDDRNKALAVLVGLADNAYYRRVLTERALDPVLKLLQLKQPANREPAFTFLGLFSKQNIAATDYNGWRQWAIKARSELK